jgi:hypothetical protein
MINSQGTFSKHGCVVVFDGIVGVKGASAYSVYAEVKVNVQISGVGPSNVVAIEGRIENSTVWRSLGTIIGANSAVIDTSSVDYIRFNVTTADSTGSLISSGFITDKSAAGGGGSGGDASAANQVIGNASLASIDTKTTATNTSLASIDGKLTKGQNTMANSTSVTIASDQSAITISGYDSVGGKLLVGSARDKLRDSFTSIDTTKWDVVSDATDIVTADGNTAGASYVKISKSSIAQDTETIFTTKDSFKMPFRIGAGISLSQRIIGQEFSIEFVGTSSSDNSTIEYNTTRTDIAISGTISVTSNVWTINTATAHGLQALDRIIIYNATDSRLNVGPIQVTAIASTTSFSITATFSNGTYTATNGMIRFQDPIGYAKNGAGYLFENTTTTNSSLVSRTGGAAAYILGSSTISSTSATQITTSAFAEAWQPASVFEMYGMMDEIDFRSYAIDSALANSGFNKRSQSVPPIDKYYKIRFRAKNLKNLSVPVGKITAISKTGTTTATVTCNNHGLTTSDFVQIYGVRDITNFPNLTAQTAVASVIDANNFTIVIGSAVTASSAGGAVIRNNNAILSPAINQNIASISRTSNLMTITLSSASLPALSNGNTIDIYGLEPAASAYEGAYKIRNLTSSGIIVVESVGADFGSITTGGAVFPRTDMRLHFFRMMDFLRTTTEVYGGRGTLDQNNAVPCIVSNTVSVSAVNTGIPGSQADISSSAITTTTTTSAITPTYGTGYQVNVPVTVVSGTAPTLDFSIEESDDTGTNWYKVYDFPRITATGIYRSPVIAMTGNRIRYVQTISGTTPSFTRSANRLQSSLGSATIYRQMFDRTIVLTTLNSTTINLFIDGVKNLELEINIGAATTPPALQIQVSNDGTNWRLIGTPLTAVASSTVDAVVNNVTAKFARAIVTTAGTAVTAGYVLVRGY